MKIILFLCTGLVLLGLGHPSDAQTLPKRSGQNSGEKKADRAVHKARVETATHPTAYDGPVVVNTQEVGEKMRTYSRPTDGLRVPIR
jgi:hypothetical protein